MKLITKELEKKFEKYPLYSQDGQGDKAKIICKFFNPCGVGTWYVMEAEKQEDNDYLFFGYVDLLEKELGYFYLSELQNLKLPFGLTIERDMYFDTCTLEDIKNGKKY